MPYIKEEHREQLEPAFAFIPENAGELNYMFTRYIDEYLAHFGVSYYSINDCIGALEGAKLELYRRVAGPYEDKKIESNGDVYSVAD